MRYKFEQKQKPFRQVSPSSSLAFREYFQNELRKAAWRHHLSLPEKSGQVVFVFQAPGTFAGTVPGAKRFSR